jgi:hypothetical protein
MLKADIATSSKFLQQLFNNIWNNEIIPSDWTKDLIIMLPIKGDIQICDNWRGITLLSVPSKVFTKILLKRIDEKIDEKLREEQAGFMKGRGCIDQIFAIRNIIEQCIEWKTTLFINYIDFRKAFDSLHRETLWKILRSYGIPLKICTLMKAFYDNFECSVILGNSISEPFIVKFRERQGCIMSPILFLVVIDRIQRQATSNKRRGIQWTMFSHLEDLDFAEISGNNTHLQEKTDRMNKYARQTRLNKKDQDNDHQCNT